MLHLLEQRQPICSHIPEEKGLSSPQELPIANSYLVISGAFVTSFPLHDGVLLADLTQAFCQEPRLLWMEFMIITPSSCPEDSISQQSCPNSGSNILSTPSFLVFPEPYGVRVYDIYVTFNDKHSKITHSLPSGHLWVFSLANPLLHQETSLLRGENYITLQV